MPRPLFDHFRLFAPIYDRVFDHEPTTRHLIARLALPVSGWLLDAGGGTGRIAQALRAQTGGVVVADVSLGMLRQVRHKSRRETGRESQGKDRLRPVQTLVECLPFADGQFERILIADAFHHFFEHEEAVSELWRVLAPGGRLLIEEPNIERWPVKLVALAERLALMRSRFFPPQAMGRMFEARGAQVTLDLADSLHACLLVEKRR